MARQFRLIGKITRLGWVSAIQSPSGAIYVSPEGKVYVGLA